MAKGIGVYPGLARIQGGRWVAVGAPELAGTELAAAAGARVMMDSGLESVGGGGTGGYGFAETR